MYLRFNPTCNPQLHCPIIHTSLLGIHSHVFPCVPTVFQHVFPCTRKVCCPSLHFLTYILYFSSFVFSLLPHVYSYIIQRVHASNVPVAKTIVQWNKRCGSDKMNLQWLQLTICLLSWVKKDWLVALQLARAASTHILISSVDRTNQWEKSQFPFSFAYQHTKSSTTKMFKSMIFICLRAVVVCVLTAARKVVAIVKYHFTSTGQTKRIVGKVKRSATLSNNGVDLALKCSPMQIRLLLIFQKMRTLTKRQDY